MFCCARLERRAFCSADFGPLYKVMRGFTSCRSVASSLLWDGWDISRLDMSCLVNAPALGLICDIILFHPFCFIYEITNYVWIEIFKDLFYWDGSRLKYL